MARRVSAETASARHQNEPRGTPDPSSFTPGAYPRGSVDSGDRPGLYASAQLDPHPAAARSARRLTRDALARWGLRHLTDDAEAIAAELAANAVAAAVPPPRTLPAIIFAVHHRPGELRITVWDNGPGKPEPTDLGPDAEAGRGLTIINTLTGSNWGWWPTPASGGKVVHATLPVIPSDSNDRERQRPC